MSVLLEVHDLYVRYRAPTRLADLFAGRRRRVSQAVNGVSLVLARGESLGLVGESGCGKSSLGRAILRLTEPTAGSVYFDGENVLALRRAELLRFRRHAQMVFQDPYASLNPRLTVAETLAEVLRVHALCPPGEVASRVGILMDQVGLSAELVSRRPRALSGGQCQRVGIARALAVGAELIIADEPASALDVSIQAQILNLLTRLQREMGLTLLFISHDLGVVHHLCRRVAVMYLGRIVEEGPTEEVFRNPRHPYTQALLKAIPRMEPTATLPQAALGGEPPSPVDIPAGCPFHPRCPQAMPVCRIGQPPARRRVGEAVVACHLYPSPGMA